MLVESLALMQRRNTVPFCDIPMYLQLTWLRRKRSSLLINLSHLKIYKNG